MFKLWRCVPFALFLSVLPALAQTDCPNIATEVSKDGTQWRQPVFVSNDAGKALPGASVTVTESGHKHAYRANGNGCFGFHAVAGSTYEIVATAPGYGSSIQTWEATGASDADTIVDQAVPPAGQLHNLDTDEITSTGTGASGSPATGPAASVPVAPGPAATTSSGSATPTAPSPAATAAAPSNSQPPKSSTPPAALPPVREEASPAQEPAAPLEKPAQPALNLDLPALSLEFLLSLVAALAFLILRESTAHLMSVSMMKQESPVDPAFVVATASTDVEARSTGDLRRGPELAEFNAASTITLSESADARVKRIRSTEWRKLLFILLSLVAHGLCTYFMFTLNHASGQGWTETLDAILCCDAVAALWALSIVVRRKLVLETAVVTFCAGATVLAIAEDLAGFKLFSVLIPVAGMVLMLGLGWSLLRKAALADDNHTLVILRLFKADQKAAATFGRLMSGWRTAGSCVTIADPSYLRYQFSVFSGENTSRSLVDILTIGSGIWLVTNLKVVVSLLGFAAFDWITAVPDKGLVGGVYLLVIMLAVLPILVYARRRFLLEPRQVIEGIEHLRDAELGLANNYPGLFLLCHPNVWKPAVDQMLDPAHEVLMDLRGFSETRPDCAYELGRLIDRFPLKRSLFLKDETTPQAPLRGLIDERWAAMNPDSPNAGLEAGAVRLFDTGEEAAKDRDAILAILAASADGSLKRSKTA